MVIAILDGVELGIRVPALLYEFTSLPGNVGIRFPVAWSIDVTADAHFLLLLRSKYLFIGSRQGLVRPSLLISGILDGDYGDCRQNAYADNNPSPVVGILIPRLCLERFFCFLEVTKRV